MFVEFQVENFRSFRDRQKFSMQAAPIRTNDGGLEEGNVFKSANQRLLKTKAIYGGNASGKSNLANALAAFIVMVKESVVQEGLPHKIWEQRFQLISDWDELPVYFQYIFSQKEKVYRYGFQIVKGNITNEWLYGRENNAETEYFMRQPDGISINHNHFTVSNFHEEQAKDGNEIFRKDALFLTAIAISGNNLAGILRNEITGIMGLNGTNKEYTFQYAAGILDKGTKPEKFALKQFMTASDTGINDLYIQDISQDLKNSYSKQTDKENVKNKTVFSSHNIYNDEGEIVNSMPVIFGLWESEGTKKLLGLSAMVLNSLKAGLPFFIDEFDAQLHPNLTLKIVELYNSTDTNPNNAQLIFITHDTGLLRRANLRRDQICIVDKDKYGISTLHTLIEYKGVRKDASYEKEYLQGSYAGVPFLDDIDSVITEMVKENGISQAK